MSNILKAIIICIIMVYYFSIRPVLHKINTELEQHNFKELTRIREYNRKINNYNQQIYNYNQQVQYYNSQAYNPIYSYQVDNTYTASDIKRLRAVGLRI
jgi:hypothetical protein